MGGIGHDKNAGCAVGETHPGLGASRALGIDPNVLGDDAALLVKFEVLVELERARRQQTAFSSETRRGSRLQLGTYSLGTRDDSFGLQ